MEIENKTDDRAAVKEFILANLDQCIEKAYTNQLRHLKFVERVGYSIVDIGIHTPFK